MANTTNQKGVYLNNQDDWEDWNTQFETRVDAAGLWEKIFSDDGDFLTMPKSPDIGNYEKKKQVAATRLTRSRATPSTNRALDEEDTVPGEEPEIGGVPPVHAGELTQAGRSAYNLDINMYTQKCRRYDDERKAIQGLKTWMVSSISPHLVRTACKPRQGIREWYRSLKEQVGVTNLKEQEDAREKYRLATKPINKPRNMLQWLDTWDKAMNLAKEKNIPEIQKSAFWFNDFVQAVKGAGWQNWCQSYKIHHKTEIEKNELSYRVVSNDFGQEIRSQVFGPTRTIAKGAFGPTYSGDQAEAEDKVDQGKGKKGKSKRRYTGGEKSGCRACRTEHHTLEKCYYVFPERAPSWFTGSTIVAEHVAATLEKDEELRKEVERLKKKSKKNSTKEPTRSKSATSYDKSGVEDEQD